MSKLICELKGVRGRSLKLYDTKCVIKTEVTVGSILTENASDGEKTVFLIDVVGVQFKKSGLTIGYLQFETPSLQMNNEKSNMFSENTFTFEDGKNGVTNQLMQEVYNYVVDRIERLKYRDINVEDNTDSAIARIENLKRQALNGPTKSVRLEKPSADPLRNAALKMTKDTVKRCPYCGEIVKGDKCEMCGRKINY